MDNNNFNGQMPNQPSMQPNVQGPMGQQNINMNMGQMPMQPMQPMQPYPQQPMMQQPPKQPMDPAKKKKIILIISIISGLVVLGIVAAILIPILLRVDYSSAYQTAKDLQSNIYEIYQSYNCEYVVDYVDSTYTSIKDYNAYVEGCKEVYDSTTDELIAKLENTDGVKRNNEIKTQFDKFKAEYTAASAGDADELATKLSLWQAWHSFKVTVSDFDYSSTTDAEFTTAANYLINSGNDTLKTYAEGWLTWSIDTAAAYRTYRSSWSSADREAYSNKRSEFQDWVAANKPDINSVAPLNFNDTSKMYSEFNKLYNFIAETYATNYNSGSGDCTEFLGEVYCE